MEDLQIRRLVDQKQLNRSIRSFVRLISRQDLGMCHDWLQSTARWRPGICVKKNLRVPFLCFSFLVSQTHSQPEWEIVQRRILAQRRGFTQGCACWVFHHHVTYHGEVIFQKPLTLGSRLGISSLNICHHISATSNKAERLIAQNLRPGETHNMQSVKLAIRAFGCQVCLVRKTPHCASHIDKSIAFARGALNS
jgi:hypothetical protein